MLSVIPPIPAHDLERGMSYLQSEVWRPPAFQPGKVLTDIRERRYAACRGAVVNNEVVWTNVVERLAVAYALLREHDGAQTKPLVMWENLESIGHEVSPEFAELGADAVLLVEIVDELLRGASVSALRLDLASRAVGRLWTAAFNGPPGFEQHIARSAVGAEHSDLSFFSQRGPMDRSAAGQGAHLVRLIDLLQAAVAMRDLPDARVGEVIAIDRWVNRIGYLDGGMGYSRTKPMEIHTQRVPVKHGVDRLTLKFVDGASGDPVGVVTATLLASPTGLYDELLDLSDDSGRSTETQVRAVFGPSDVVTIYPRVRRLLDACENRLHRLMVIEHLFVASHWRGRGLGKRLLRQALVEGGGLGAVLGHPAALEPRSAFLVPSMGVEAGYAAARLRLARYWHEMGAEYLIHGVMGLPMHAIEQQRARGAQERLNP